MAMSRKRSIIRDKAGNARQTLMTRGPASIRKYRRTPEKTSWTKSASHLVGKADSVMIEDYENEEVFLANLKTRYEADVIYTYIRGVCISVNPYQDLDMYTGGLIDEYYGTQLYEVPPHLYAIANQAYYSMKEENSDQCVLISGESGAGKTEAAKQILQFLASTSTNTGLSKQIRDKLLQSNPILEAFGNAKTLRNDNSSRFGKYMEVQFDFKGEPIGGKIVNYLLEKSRVVNQMDGERNFHMFYMLLADAIICGDRELAGTGDDFHYTKQGNMTKVETLDDFQEMHNMVEAMSGLGMSQEEQGALFNLVAFIMQLGEVEFDGAEAATIKNMAVITAIEKLVGVPADTMAASLTNNTIVARGETVSSPLKPAQAAYARDALGKSVYYRAFDWLVERLNKAFITDGAPTAGRSTVMGLLDIYGFEILAKNGFEQICINYCNEKLQQLFIELTLKSEQAEYKREGIEWVPVEYFDNHVLCEMIESDKKPFGLISVLNDCSIAPGDPKDEDFLSAMDNAFSAHAHYSSFQADKSLGRTQFVVKHYAGDVAYTIDGFLDANNDLLYRDLKVAMLASTNEVINATFKSDELESMKRPATAGTQFRRNMNDLMDILMAKTPSYVRCIKPNGEKKANHWDDAAVQHQVKYLGLMESLRVARAGYCYRRPFDHFLERYKSLCPDTWPAYFGDSAGGVEALAAYLSAPKVVQDKSPWAPRTYHLGLEKGEIAVGNTKVFIRSPKSVTAIEMAFQEHKNWIATRIAAAWRGYAQRKKFLKLKAAAITAQKFARVVLANNWAVKRKAAVDQVRKFIKGFIHRKDPVSPVNEMFVTFARKAWLLNLVQALPKKVLDTSWIPDSTTPAALIEVSSMLKTLAHSNNCRKYRLALSAEKRDMLARKLLAETLFSGRKANYRASVGVPFTANRIEEGVVAGARAAFDKVKTPGETIKYSTLLHKFDRSTYKHKRDDVVIVTETMCRVFGDAPKFKEKIALPLTELSMISVSDMSDGVIIISTPGQKVSEGGVKGDKGDFIFDTPFVIEFATYLVMSKSVKPGPESPAGERFHGVKDSLKEGITIAPELTPMLKGQKPGKVLFAVGEAEYQIVKDGSGKALKVLAPETKTADAFSGRVRASLRQRAK